MAAKSQKTIRSYKNPKPYLLIPGEINAKRKDFIP